MKRTVALISILGGLIVIVGLGAGYKKYCDSVYYEGYEAALPLDAVVRADTTDNPFRMVDFTYQSVPGQTVPTLLALPKDGVGPFPCIIFLHGIGQDKTFLPLIAEQFTESGFAIASFDQYTRGERKLGDKGVITQAMGMRRRSALNVIDTRRLVDYLETRDDIAANRIYLVGASFGAITGSTAAAFEPRIRAAVLTYGGGDIGKLLDSRSAHEEMGAWHGLVSAFAKYYLAPSDPVLHVAEISPRPVLMQNGTDDRLIPMSAAEALFDAAKEPKEFVPYESDHIGLDEAHVRRVLADTIVWLHEQDRVTLAKVG